MPMHFFLRVLDVPAAGWRGERFVVQASKQAGRESSTDGWTDGFGLSELGIGGIVIAIFFFSLLSLSLCLFLSQIITREL